MLLGLDHHLHRDNTFALSSPISHMLLMWESTLLSFIQNQAENVMQQWCKCATGVHLQQHSNHSTCCFLQVPMKQQALADCKDTVHEVLRKLSEQDRDIMEKGIKAFVSFVRAYKEHQCKFIFRLADLDLAQLATALGLLRLPKMPEMRKTKQRLEGFTPSALDPNDVKVSFLHTFILLLVS